MTSVALTHRPANSRVFQALTLGAFAALAALALYALLFAVYAITRSSLQILGTLSAGDGIFGTWVANAFSIGFAACSVTLLLSFLVAPLGALTLLLAHGASRWLNPDSSPRHRTLDRRRSRCHRVRVGCQPRPGGSRPVLYRLLAAGLPLLVRAARSVLHQQYGLGQPPPDRAHLFSISVSWRIRSA